MKTLLQLSLCFFLFVSVENISAQVTKLSNNTNLSFSITLGNKALLATLQDSIWVTDGTAAGTQKLVNDAIITSTAVVYKNKVYFSAYTVAKGAELWVSDCTTGGTKLFKDINAGVNGSLPRDFYVFNNTLFFFAYTNADGYELWKTDGTSAGTKQVKDIYNGANSGYDSTNSYFFAATSNYLFFTANDASHGNEIWRTDGTGAGTKLVKDLNPGTGSFTLNAFNTLNNEVIFSGKDGDAIGIKIWKSDGTTPGTTVIKKLQASDDCSSVYAIGMSKFKNQLVFATEGYIINFPFFSVVNKLYATDATAAGTKLFKDLGDSTLSPAFTLTPTIDDNFYFTTYTNKGNLLWQSDATTKGTKVVKQIGTSLNLNLGHVPFIVADVLVTNADSLSTKNYNGKFFMAADDGVHGYEPWITDGTKSGTRLVKDIYSGTGSSLTAYYYLAFYSRQGLYFPAFDNVTGQELWTSDGTTPGTKEVADINPGSASSYPFFVGLVNKHLLVGANDGDNTQGKTDLYKVNATFDTLKEINNAVATIAPDGSSFSIYPNPAKDQLHVSLDKNLTSKHISFIITDSKGKQLFAQEVKGADISPVYNIDISKYAQGIYYLQMITDKGSVSNKFIKVN